MRNIAKEMECPSLNNTFKQNFMCYEEEEPENENAFPGLYKRPDIRAAMFTTYMVTLCGISGLVFIHWFERSGQAGHYRTVINQLISFNIDQVSAIFEYSLFSPHCHIIFLTDDYVWVCHVFGFSKSVDVAFSLGLLHHQRLHQKRHLHQHQSHHLNLDNDEVCIHLWLQEDSHHGR